MPAWKKHDTGRRGRDVYETEDRFEAPRKEAAHSRIERLTATATALGSGYGPQHGPQHGNEHDEDLSAVADELDRLLSERGDHASRAPRKARVPQSFPHRGEVSGTPGRRAPGRDRAREMGMDDVMGALDRLDEQVQGLAASEGEEDFHHSVQRSRRLPGRYALDDFPDEPSYGESAYYPDAGEGHYADVEAAEAAYRRRDRTHRDASMHIYKDLGRRIDALRAPQEKALNQVREELGSLREALGGISRGTSETVGRQNAELRRLADMVERLRADKKNDLLAKEIRKEVTDLKAMVGRTNVEGALQTLEHGYSHILQRLDELSRASVDPRILRGVTARLNEIEDAFAALPRSEHMLVLEDRVVGIAERVEELLQRKSHADIEPLRAELREVRGFVEQIDIKGLVEGIDDRMKFVSGRLDDLEVLAREQRGLDSRLSAMEERMPEPETLSRLQGRLEDIVGMMADERAAPAENEHLFQVDRRLDDIVDRLERMEQSAPLPSADAGAFEALESRLETIAGKIDAIEKKASRPVPVLDAAAMRSVGGPDSKFLTQLQERLNDLTERLEQPSDTVTTGDLDKLREEIGSMRASVAAPASTEALEQRISDLAQVVSRGAEVTDDSRFEQLGAKVAALAEQIETSSSGPADSDRLAPVLERIEKGLEQTRFDVAGIAKQAAEEAIANAPATGGHYDDAIAELQGDLKRLLDAAEGSDERTRNTFDSVKSVLGSLTERLDKLERADIPETSAAPAMSYMPIQAAEKASAFASAHTPAEKTEPRAPEEKARDRKADFIAAARRAAQAASAEAAKLEKTQKTGPNADAADEERGKARIGWLRNVLKRDKGGDVDEAETENAGDLELDADHVAETPHDGDEARLFPGDRPAPEMPQGTTGRRRAILYTAAAVLLLMGTLTVYRVATNSPQEGEQLASVPKDSTVTAETVAGDKAADVAKAAPVEADPAAAPKDVATGREPDGARTNAETVSKVTGNDATQKPGGEASPKAAASATASGTTPLQGGGDVKAASASGTLGSEKELAFAPPSGVAGSFSDKPADNPSGFTAAKETETTPASAPANLIASLPPEGVGPMALRSAAASGNPAAEFLVGVKYTEGSGVPADMQKAAAWYQKAADQGLAPAQYRLASLYEKGRGVRQDLEKAKAWYTKAAEAGNAKAMHNLAVLYAEGGGGQPDYKAAAKWFELAANYGVKDSLFNLGILYAGGIGVDRDLVASYKWFAIAADQGDPEAAKRRDDVANMMDQDALAKARLAVENFKLKTPAAAANKVMMDPGWTEGSSSLPAERVSVDAQALDNTAMIREAQDKLNYLGFDTGTPDGRMGPRTRSAIRAFQRSLGVPETGEVDGKLIDELKSQAI
ncbi:peptidoglycan-binding protein [Roseibium aggregatum]|uniref:SEL1-like repeat protein n=1 Tax=Roseibium aggregatum TaxID=187304 RepID=A0A939ECG7_9HYPH|nr:peptidoglycan-binding protein [Roseibium aggregatum]MBN9669340.1 SEL1-like repeat protein [Roseibium aggregatum]